jgi:DNA polymerase-4
MRGARARRLCPDVVTVDPSFDDYTKASRELFEVFRSVSPVVEGISLEEAFLDVTGMEHIWGTPAEIGAHLRSEVGRRVGLPVTVGGGTSKIVAKMASRAAKPDGLRIVAPGEEAAFLHPLDAAELWGVGPSTARKLDRAMIRTVGDLARRTEAELTPIVGKAAARQLHAISNARDYRRVRSGRSRSSFGTQSAMDGRPRTPAELDSILVGLVDRVTGRMRRANRAGRTVVLRLRYRDFVKASRSRTMHRSSATTATVLAAARSLLADAMPTIRSRGLTLLGVAVTNLDGSKGIQLELPLEPPHRQAVDLAVDEIRTRFGSDALRRASFRSRRGHGTDSLDAEPSSS